MKKNNFINSDKIYLFHNNRCSKSREVKKYVDDNKINEIIDYLNTFPEESFLKTVFLKLENNFPEIIRVNEKIYKNLNDNEKIIQSIICRPTELINSIFS